MAHFGDIPDDHELLCAVVAKSGGEVEIYAHEFRETIMRMRAHHGGLEIFVATNPHKIVLRINDPSAPVQETAKVVDVVALPDLTR